MTADSNHMRIEQRIMPVVHAPQQTLGVRQIFIDVLHFSWHENTEFTYF